jgi:phage shock protein B
MLGAGGVAANRVANINSEDWNQHMQGAMIVSIVFGGIVLALAIIGGTILMAIRFLKSGGSRAEQEREAKMIQEIYQNLAHMEKRMEALETILLDREEKDAAHEI